ncbi:CD209 antigen-like protein [Labeo rohita]|uniref:CD209 antigen-like protein n=1 Tax=Labeo rohita TaxID=84645 RepID=A0A498MTG0_LABRO|nr:C-type lectin domain family 17, member A-like [Labeo rohita]RXN23143.1 CD209 antigen-like protein [Labeo rohita]
MHEIELKYGKQINSNADRDARIERDPPPPYTGSDSVRIRKYRVAVVCLVLLCVLLLTAVIVLCVHIHTKNRNLYEGKDEWIYYQSSLYLISSERRSWDESRRHCKQNGADLVIINNIEEQNFVKKISHGADLWTGLTDRDVEGTWKWVDGSTPTSGFWAAVEPNGSEDEDCALSEKGGLADYPCHDAFNWICEKNI